MSHYWTCDKCGQGDPCECKFKRAQAIIGKFHPSTETELALEGKTNESIIAWLFERVQSLQTQIDGMKNNKTWSAK